MAHMDYSVVCVCTCQCMCVCTCTHTYAHSYFCVSVLIKGEPVGTGSVLLPDGSGELKSGPQVWWQALLPAEPSHRPPVWYPNGTFQAN